MTRGEAIKDFFYKTILPVVAAALLYCLVRSACLKNGELDYLWLWILCGLPFGIWRLRLWHIADARAREGGSRVEGGLQHRRAVGERRTVAIRALKVRKDGHNGALGPRAGPGGVVVAAQIGLDRMRDHTRRRLPGQWDRLVRAELYSGRDHRRFRSGLAADRGGVVCAADG